MPNHKYKNVVLLGLAAIIIIGILESCVSSSVKESAKKNVKEIEYCSEKDFAILDSVEAGNLEYLKMYIKKGGSPTLECYEASRLSDYPGTHRLVDRAMSSNSYRVIDYYTTLELPNEYMDDLLTHFATDTLSEICSLLVQRDAHFLFSINSCLPINSFDSLAYDRIGAYGYNFNWVDPEWDMTDFMKYCECPCPDGAEQIIQSLEYLRSKGADPKWVNSSGKTAKDFAEHPDIKKYLDSIP
ncbi:MAG: hypothetical protein ACJA1C_002157 [Crocinitomicaceae bacterium]|jgi:hypothetical protein